MLKRVKSTWSLTKGKFVGRNNSSSDGSTRQSGSHSGRRPAPTATTSFHSNAPESHTSVNEQSIAQATTEISKNPYEQSTVPEQTLLEGIEESPAFEESVAIEGMSFHNPQERVAHKASSESTGTVIRTFNSSTHNSDFAQSAFMRSAPELREQESTNTLQMQTSDDRWKQVLNQGARILDAAADGCEIQLQIVDGLTSEGERCSRVMNRLSFDIDRLIERKEAKQKHEATMEQNRPTVHPVQNAIGAHTNLNDPRQPNQRQRAVLRIRNSMSVLKRPSTWFRS